MPDGENPENQDPTPQPPPGRSMRDIFGKPPVEPRIKEPDPDYDPSTGYLDTTTPEEKQKLLFREAAKRLAKEEREIYELAIECGSLSEQSPFFLLMCIKKVSWTLYITQLI